MFNFSENYLADQPIQTVNSSLNLKGKKKLEKRGHHARTLSPLLEIEFFTDPLCPISWGIEPFIKQLSLDYGRRINIQTKMRGLLMSWDEPSNLFIKNPEEMASFCSKAGRLFKMPMSSDAWLNDAPHSSYPASIAFKAAQIESKNLAQSFLRRLREMLFVEGKNISKWKHICRAASEAGLDPDKLLTRYNNGEGLQAFLDDITRSEDLDSMHAPILVFPGKDVQFHLGKTATLDDVRQFIETELGFVKSETDYMSTDLDSCFDNYSSWTLTELKAASRENTSEIEQFLLNHEQQGTLFSFGCPDGRVWTKIA